MGVCIRANGSKIEFNMSYGAFHNLRRNIATAIDPEFAQLYHEMFTSIFMADRLEAEKKLNDLLLDDDKFPDSLEPIFDFLFASDVDGTINYKGCKSLYDLIKDIDFSDKGFQYVSHRSSTNDYELFKTFLRECYKYHRHMRWS